MDDIAATVKVDGFVVISNHKFAEQFEGWAAAKQLPITVVDDGIFTNETRLGAVRDIQFALDKMSIQDDCLSSPETTCWTFLLQGSLLLRRGKAPHA